MPELSVRGFMEPGPAQNGNPHPTPFTFSIDFLPHPRNPRYSSFSFPTEYRAKSFKLKILPVSYSAPRIFWRFPAKFMISIDHGGGGWGTNQQTFPQRNLPIFARNSRRRVRQRLRPTFSAAAEQEVTRTHCVQSTLSARENSQESSPGSAAASFASEPA